MSTAIASAELTSTAVLRALMAQPTTLRLNTSSTVAKYTNPSAVGTYTMSATHSRLGSSARNSRLQRNASALFRDFTRGDRTDHTVTVTPSADALHQRPQTAFQPCRVRLIKYTAGTTTYTLATTLLDRQRYSLRDLADLYHGRWSIKELYKISKQLLTVEEFHGQTERTVQQEQFAHFSLIALARLFTNRSEESFRADPGKPPCWARPSSGSSPASPRAASARTAPSRASPGNPPANGGPVRQPQLQPQPEVRKTGPLRRNSP